MCGCSDEHHMNFDFSAEVQVDVRIFDTPTGEISDCVRGDHETNTLTRRVML